MRRRLVIGVAGIPGIAGALLIVAGLRTLGTEA